MAHKKTIFLVDEEQNITNATISAGRWRKSSFQVNLGKKGVVWVSKDQRSPSCSYLACESKVLANQLAHQERRKKQALTAARQIRKIVRLGFIVTG